MEFKYPVIEAWVRTSNGYDWLEIDIIDYCDDSFLILDAIGNEKYYKLSEHDLRVGREVITCKEG